MIRRAFVPSQEGWVILGADYSQIELRILAHISNTESLIDAFKHGEDIHKKTAMDVFKVSEEEMTSDLRRSAKAINFGIIYGMSAFGLSENLNITQKHHTLSKTASIPNPLTTKPKKLTPPTSSAAPMPHHFPTHHKETQPLQPSSAALMAHPLPANHHTSHSPKNRTDRLPAGRLHGRAWCGRFAGSY